MCAMIMINVYLYTMQVYVHYLHSLCDCYIMDITGDNAPMYSGQVRHLHAPISSPVLWCPGCNVCAIPLHATEMIL